MSPKDLTARDLPFGHELTWRYMLPWLSRDQECRLARLLEWRDPVTESHRPEMTGSDACYIMRSVMGLITKSEEDVQRKHRALLNRQKELDSSVPLLKHQAKQALQRVRLWAKDQALEQDMLFANIRETLNREARDITESPELRAARERRDAAQSAVEARLRVVGTREDDMARQRALLATDRAELQALQGNVHRHTARAEMDSEAPSPLGRCNVPLRVAEARGCHLARGRQIDFESHKNLNDAKAEVAAYQEVVRDDEAAVKAMEDALAQAQVFVESVRREHESSAATYEALRADANRRCGILEQRLDEVKAAEAVWQRGAKETSELDRIKREVDASLRKQEGLRRRADEKRTRVNVLPPIGWTGTDVT